MINAVELGPILAVGTLQVVAGGGEGERAVAARPGDLMKMLEMGAGTNMVSSPAVLWRLGAILLWLAAPAGAPDRDGDRIPDEQDRCPDQPETYNQVDDEDGCPDQGRVIVKRHDPYLERRVLFAPGSATVLPEFGYALHPVLDLVRGQPQVAGVEVQGHADAGEPARLSADRGRAVVKALVAEGVPADKLIMHDYGTSHPACETRDEDCRLRNRRVEFRVMRSALETDPRGWIDITPDPKLTGWTRVAPISTAGVKSAVDPRLQVWRMSIRTGILDCRGDLPPASGGGKGGSHEMLRYEKELGDFTFHVEWRFTDPHRAGWNAGVYARVNEKANVWHQAQVGGGSGGYWFGDTPDATGKIVRRKVDSMEQRVRPAGLWNTYELTAQGDRLTLWVNGAITSELSGLQVRRGHVGLEAELHHIEFRNLMLKELP